MNREASRKLFVPTGFLARSRYILEKLFSREPSGSIVLGQKFRLRMKCLEVICSYLTRSLTHVFVIVKTNAFGIDGGRLVLVCFTFEYVAFVFCRDPSTFGFERLLSCVKIALIANRVFSKTCLEVFIQVL